MPYLFFILLSLLSCQLGAESTATAGASSPIWLQAVGTLSIPGQRFEAGERNSYREDCTATLVAAQTILTAWHCLEYYGDLSQPIVFSLPQQPQHLPLAATLLDDGGGMSSDWALLRLEKPLRDIAPVPVHANFVPRKDHQLSIAGYSRDPGLSDPARELNWQKSCLITLDEHFRVATDCAAQKGTSGGPVFADGAIVGVISAGDGTAITYYAPSAAFIRALRRHQR